jgi:hypothetical protein
MATKQQEQQPADAQKQGRPETNSLIGKNVLHMLGQPGNLIRVQVRTLWGDYCRVNVFAGSDAASTKIAHSFFVHTDAEGNILSSAPTITKQY